MNSFKNFFKKDFLYNALSLISVFFGFVFIVLIGRKFGASKESDIYFLSVVIINYLGYFVQSVWEAFTPYYAEMKISDKKRAYALFSVLLNYLAAISLFIVFCYYLFSGFINLPFFSADLKNFLDVFIFYLLFQNILFLNKTILNLEGFYASFYLVDIFVFSVNIITIEFFVKDDLTLIAYSTLMATAIANVWQFKLIFKNIGMKYSLSFYSPNIGNILKNSFKLKLGSFFIGIKDIIIASVLTGFGSGIYSLYAYANKFLGVILQIINAPIVNIFAAKATHLIAKGRFYDTVSYMKSVLSKTVILYVFSSIFTYFAIPFIIAVLFSDKFTQDDILTVRTVFFIMSFYYFFTVLYSPIGRVLTILKRFNFLLFCDFLFTAVLVLLVKSFHFEKMETLLYFLVCAHAVLSAVMIFYFFSVMENFKKGKVLRYV